MESRLAVNPTVWHWLALGGVLLAAEVFVPGFVFLWLGVSAGLTGLLFWLLPWLTWQWQVLIFAALAVASVSSWLWWRRRVAPVPADALNHRAMQYVGSEAVLVGAIADGHGRVRLADTTWLADGPPLPAGTRVRVVGARGTLLIVEPIRDEQTSPH